MNLRSLFWNDDERRLRAGWRLLLAFLFVAVPTVVASGLFAVTVGLGTGSPRLVALTVSTVGMLVGALVGIPLAARFLDRRPVRAYGFHLDRDWWRDFGFGLALGAVLVSAIVAVELAFGWASVTGVLVVREAWGSFAVPLALELALFCCVAFYEELLARGYLLRNAAEGLVGFGRRRALAAALACSSLVFALAHAANPDATVTSVLGVLVAGGFLGIGYVLTDELALPIGAHLSWNTAMGAVYGLPVSGLTLPATVVAVDQHGPTVATGGKFGPEAGLLGVAAVLVGAGACVWWARRTGRESFDPTGFTGRGDE
ncbi:CPBP family intramembrane glutamic endopeptidase [Halospeciosus flavus]|uniref:CPBP family intramembrane glutamic endopeptidase n=1 Tax=Halospeciosus flavus TaxID=3032283 RepID=A0ABD5Z463_9EURY|nr:CPBP family intramembrane glutamic endopeptidase [Halospeciosus flavus]